MFAIEPKLLYLIVILILSFAAELLYFRIADRFNIIDKPNERSSHTSITLRGGGIIFPIVTLISYLFFKPETSHWTQAICFLTGLLTISVISFWDDVSNLPNKVRILVHLIAVSLLLYSLNAFQLLPWYGILLGYIIIIGTINAYNFMDGINGITGLYSLVALLSIFYYNKVYPNPDSFSWSALQADFNTGLLLSSILACVVFLFFNFRKKAKCFAGDVGSVSIGFTVLYFLLAIVFNDIKFVFFLAVYGVDTVLTIIHRLILKQNIFQAHRLHFYQILANEQKIPHRTVSLLYALLQLIINLIIIHTDFDFVGTGFLVCTPLGLTYILLKPRLMKPKAV